MGSFGTTEIILIVAVLFLLFGATRLPQLAKALGQSKKAFKEGINEAEEADERPASRSAGALPPNVAQMSDDEIMAEMKRRQELKNAG